MSPVFFSVIIPTYERASLLRQTLRSLQSQTFSDYEAFIVDDGSTDNTQEIITEFTKNSNWQFIRFEKNNGYPYCKNYAFKKAKGEYFTFLDSDDMWLPDRLEKFYNYIQSNPNAGFIFSNGYIYQDGAVISTMCNNKKKIPTGKLPGWTAVSNYCLPYVTTNVAIKREAVLGAGDYLENMIYLGDTEFFARVIKSYEVGYIPELLSVYRVHPVSITHSWQDCLKESMFTLNSTNPPKEIYTSLKNYIYYNQATVFIKNGHGKKARKCLNEIKEKGNLKIVLPYIFSFTPRLVLTTLRFFYKKYRKLKLRLFAPKEFKTAEKWLVEISK